MDSFFGLDRPNFHSEDAELLTTTYDPVDLSIVRSILDGEKIPYLIRERGSGSSVSIIAGYSTFGTDIFVPKKIITEAKELLDAYRNAPPAEEESGAAPENGEEGTAG